MSSVTLKTANMADSGPIKRDALLEQVPMEPSQEETSELEDSVEMLVAKEDLQEMLERPDVSTENSDLTVPANNNKEGGEDHTSQNPE